MCDQQSLRSACANAQSDQSLCLSLEYSLTVKLLTEHHLEFLNLKGGYTGSPESTLVKMPHCWKSHVTAQCWKSHVTAQCWKSHVTAQKFKQTMEILITYDQTPNYAFWVCTVCIPPKKNTILIWVNYMYLHKTQLKLSSAGFFCCNCFPTCTNSMDTEKTAL